MEVGAAELDLPIQEIGKIASTPTDQATIAAGVQIVRVAHEAGLAVVGDDQVVALLGPEDVIANVSADGIVLDANVIALRRIERVVDDINAGGVDEQTNFRVAVDEVPRDKLVRRGVDADAVPRDAIELDRAGDGHPDVVQLDQIGVVEIVAAECAGACDAGRIGEDVLALHPAVDECDAGRVVVYLVGGEIADEPEGSRSIADRRPHAQCVVRTRLPPSDAAAP